MLAWILILSPWVALLSLILHDATKEDSDGSAISIAAKNFKAFIFWAILKARKLLGALSDRASPTSLSKPAVKGVAAVKAISSSSIRRAEPSVIKQAPALSPKNLPPKKKWWLRDHRVSVTIPQLQLAIS